MEMESGVQPFQTTVPNNRLCGPPGTLDTLRRWASMRLGDRGLHTVIGIAALHQHSYLCAQLGQLEGAWSKEVTVSFMMQCRYPN